MNRRHYLGIFVISATTLLLELALTRVLSVALWYHFSFLVISTALLGFGASGVTLAMWTRLREGMPLDFALSALSLALGAVTVFSYWLMQRIPFDPFNLLIDRKQFLFMPVYYLNLTLPFFFSGLVIALLFSRGSKYVNRLYAADLLGAGIGCGAIAVVMPAFGGSGSVLFAAMLAFLAAFIFGYPQSRRLAFVGGVLFLVMIPVALVGDHMIPISILNSKHHPLEPTGQKPIFTGWSSVSKIDVYKLPSDQERGRPKPGLSIIVDSGASGTEIPDLSAGVQDYLARSNDFQGSGIAYLGKQHPKVLIIGSGAGREVLEALTFGASSITAVEINPLITKIVTKDLQSNWGGLFEQPEVHLVTEDGRSFMSRSRETYDAIVSIQTMSDAALLSGAMSLSETYILTREAFEDYYDHLTPNGILMMTRAQHQIPKLITTTREMFERRGLGNGSDHILSFQGPVLPYGHARFLSCFLMKKTAWTPSEVAAIEKRVGIGKPPIEGSDIPEIYYSPLDSAHQESSFSRRLYRLANAPDLQALYRSSGELLAPSTDDQPFFNQRIRWATLRPAAFRDVFAAGKKANVDLQPIAEVCLTFLLIQTIAIGAILIWIPLLRLSRRGLRAPNRWTFLTYFGGLGLGFIMVELALLQRFTLFLGQPVYTLAAVLAGLLISCGVGSYATARFRESSRRPLLPIFALILCAIAGTMLFTPYVFSIALGLALPWRLVISLILIAPLGFLLGMPFPNGLRIVAEEAPELVPWAWGVNGFFTVIGSVSAIVLAMAFGFRVVLAVAACCYLIALGAIMLPSTAGLALRRRHLVLGEASRVGAPCD